MPLVYQAIYFVSVFLILAIGALVFFRRPKDTIVRLFAMLMVVTASWILSLYYFYLLIDSVSLVVVGRVNYVFAELIAYFAFLFARSFPEHERVLSKRSNLILTVLTAGLVVVTLCTDLVDENEVVRGIDRATSYGPLFPAFVAYYVGIAVASVVVLLNKIRKFEGRLKSQLLMFLVAWGGAAAFGATTNIFIPLFTRQSSTQHLGPLAAVFFAVVVGFAVVRFEMLNTTLIAAEFFMLALALLFVVNLSLAVSPIASVIDGFILVIGIAFGYALIRSVRKEVRDRERTHALADKLEVSNRSLRQLSDAKSEFISIASHQLRTPVSVIKGYLSLMKDGAYGTLGGALRDKIDQMFEMNERLIHLINNLLNVTRIERDKIEFYCRETDVVGIIVEVLGEMALEARGKKLQLIFNEPAKSLPKAFVDPDKLHEVIVNLVDNAIKYTPRGSVEVKAEYRPEAGQIHVRVKDTGRGMDEEDVTHVFEKFFRPKQDNAERQSGMSMGLGLFICAKFLRSMGGDIWIEQTAPGQGTTLAISLPVKASAACEISNQPAPASA